MIDILFPYFIGSIAFNLILFLVAYKIQSDKLTDISYSLTFIGIAVTAFLFNDHTPYSYVLLGMVLAWAFRIGVFLLVRVMKSGKDARFDTMRSRFFAFGRFWILQGISVWVIMLPSVLAFYGDARSISIFSYVAAIIFAAGLIVESIADYQKYKFTRNLANKGNWISTGIWAYSRHPNYFGEIVVWVGVYLYAVTILNPVAAIIAAVSPLFISGLLLFVSGIPLLEKAADKRWGKEPAYAAYKKQTSLIVPWPPKKQGDI